MNYTPPKQLLECLKKEQHDTGQSFQTIITKLLMQYFNNNNINISDTTPQSTKYGREEHGTKTEDIFTNR